MTELRVLRNFGGDAGCESEADEGEDLSLHGSPNEPLDATRLRACEDFVWTVRVAGA